MEYIVASTTCPNSEVVYFAEIIVQDESLILLLNLTGKNPAILQAIKSYHQYYKDKLYIKAMTEDRLKLQTIMTKRTNKKAASLLLFWQETIEMRNYHNSNFSKIPFYQAAFHTFDFTQHTSQSVTKL